jgi:cytochrome c
MPLEIIKLYAVKQVFIFHVLTYYTTVVYMKKALLLSFLVGSTLLHSCTNNKSYERPRDPWVFRSVLDKQPRMITAALHKELLVAYDARYGGLYKAWKGDVLLEGAVYNTQHGPQPSTDGYAYYEQRLSESPFRIMREGKETTPSVRWRGHAFKNNQVIFKYALEDGQSTTIFIDETPEFITTSGKPGLQRKFSTQQVPEGTSIILKTPLTNLQDAKDYSTNSKYTVTNQVTNTYDNGSTITLEGYLDLKSNDVTELLIYYHPGFEAAKPKAEETPTDMLTQGSNLINGSDCKTCHNEKVKTIGPSYTDIAKKYEFNEASVINLVEKIVQGGSGVWGEVAMTAHPDLQKEDAAKMVHYILSLDGETMKQAAGAGDLFLNKSAVELQPRDAVNQKETGEKPGLAYNAYKHENLNASPYELPKLSKPMASGVATMVHFDDAYVQKLPPEFRENVYVEFTGFVNIESEGNYVFRLISDDGSHLYIDDKELVDNEGFHGPEAKDGELILKKGKHKIKITFWQGKGGAALSLQWAKHGDNAFSVVPAEVLSHDGSQVLEVVPYVSASKLKRNVPGDQRDEAGVHPMFDLKQARPESFRPMVGGMDFMSDSSLLICTWDSVGPVYRLEGVVRTDAEKIKVTRIASGLAEPLGLKVVNDTIYVLQKQELTRLIDTDKDGIIDEYQTVCDGWRVSANFHEFAFGLVYKDGYFYAALATAIEPGGASAKPQIPDRGKVVKISKKDGSFEFIAHGLRTPNGVGIGVDNEIFITDNQGDWLPSSKVVHVRPEAWFGSRSVDFEGTANLKEAKPVAWLPQDEIGNSPSQPVYINIGQYKGQQLHGEVTHGGLKRVFVEKVNGEYQGAVFRFTQGLEGGVNRVVWGPDGALYVGMIGNPGNWGHAGGKWYGVQKLIPNDKTAFEMLAVRAKSNGVEIEMTEPIAEEFGNAVSDYQVQQWYYLPTKDYGGPKMDAKTLPIQSLNISEDRKKIFLELKGMEPNHVVYVRLKGIFQSVNNKSLWTTEAWYTMNEIPKGDNGFSRPAKALQPNTLSQKEKEDGWRMLFDGKTTSGWRNFNSDRIGSAWKVKDGALYLDNSKKKEWQVEGGGDIVTNDEFENFELSLEWKVQPCGNSGIMFNVVEDKKYNHVWLTGPEMQILDNTCHPDGQIDKHRAGNLYDLIEGPYVSANPAGEWNKARILVNKGHLELWLNGHKQAETEMFTPSWEEMIKASKFKDMPDFGKARKGRISLQDHGDQVWFRNIKVRELNN